MTLSTAYTEISWTGFPGIALVSQTAEIHRDGSTRQCPLRRNCRLGE